MFYECLYDSLEDSADRDTIGRALAQKHAFVSAADAILKNHDVRKSKMANIVAANDCIDFDAKAFGGEHLKQENMFQSSLSKCLATCLDNNVSELIEHHLSAAKIGLAAVKSTSLKL